MLSRIPPLRHLRKPRPECHLRPEVLESGFLRGQEHAAFEDRLNLQLRAEFFNIFNHPNFALPNWFVVPGSAPGGLITQTPDQAQTNPGLGGGGPRVIQLAAKLTF